MQIELTYNSNHIEGSKLTADQTRYIFETNTIGVLKDEIVNVDDIIETANHFRCIDTVISSYSKKLSDFAYFILGKENDNVICFIAYYKNLQNMQFYVSLLCVQEKFQRNGLGHKMMEILSKNKDFSSIGLEVNKVNTKAYNFYIKENFTQIKNS